MAADQNFTVHGFNQCAGDNQSQPGAAKLACGAGIRLGKGGKYFADLGVGHADTGILNFKLDAVWIVIFIIISLMILLFLLLIIIFIIDYLQIRLNCICICMGIRLSDRYSFLSIPLFCICRRRNNTRILPIIAPKLYTSDEYCDLTGNKIIVNPDNSIFLGIKY